MSALDRSEWGDARLNELALRVERAATKEEISSLRRELTERSDGVNKNVDRVGRKFDALAGDPVAEGRQKKQAIIVGIAAALSGVGATSLLYIVSGATPH